MGISEYEQLIRTLRNIPTYPSKGPSVVISNNNPYVKYKENLSGTNLTHILIDNVLLSLGLNPQITLNDAINTVFYYLIEERLTDKITRILSKEITSKNINVYRIKESVLDILVEKRNKRVNTHYIVQTPSTDSKEVNRAKKNECILGNEHLDEMTELNKQCILNSSGVFLMKVKSYKEINLYNITNGTAEVVEIPEGMVVGELRKDRNIDESYCIKENETVLGDDHEITTDLTIETVTKPLDRKKAIKVYSVSQKFTIFHVPSTLKLGKTQIHVQTKGILYKTQTIEIQNITEIRNNANQTLIKYQTNGKDKKVTVYFKTTSDQNEFRNQINKQM